jgi:hypothetical protein
LEVREAFGRLVVCDVLVEVLEFVNGEVELSLSMLCGFEIPKHHPQGLSAVSSSQSFFSALEEVGFSEQS